MTLMPRLFRACLLGTGLMLGAMASAQQYPGKSINMIVPFTPGGINDVLARLVGDRLSRTLGQPVLVLNRPGAAGNIGAREVARAAPDGYTVLVTSNSVVLNTVLQPGLMGFDLLADLQPVVLAARSTAVLAVHASVPVKTVGEFVAFARSKPGEIKVASAGVGSPAHFLLKTFEYRTGTDFLEIPYSAAPQQILALRSGEVQFAFANMEVIRPFLETGTVKALAVTSERRSDLLPDLPTIEEAGVSGLNDDHWMGYFVPRGTPPEVVKRLAEAVNDALRQPEIKSKLARGAITVDGHGTSAGFEQKIRSDVQTYRKLMKEADIALE